MKKYLLISLIIIAAGLIIGGCAEPAPEPTTTPAPAPPAPTEVIELKYSSSFASVHPTVPPIEAFAQRVEDRTDGRVIVTLYHSASLLSPQDAYPGLLDGVADIILATSWVIPQLEFETIGNLPCLGWTSENCLAIRKEFEKEFPEIVTAARSNVKTLALQMATVSYLNFVKAEVRVPDDLNGLKLIGTPPVFPFYVACGAAPAEVHPPEHYGALEKGIVDGISMNSQGLEGNKMDEVTFVHLMVPFASSPLTYMMNLEKWNSLPSDIQKVIDDTSLELEQDIYDIYLKNDAEEIAKLKSLPDHKVIEPTAAELAQWEEKALIAHKQWVEDMEAKGYPAQAAYDKLTEIIAKYK